MADEDPFLGLAHVKHSCSLHSELQSELCAYRDTARWMMPVRVRVAPAFVSGVSFAPEPMPDAAGIAHAFESVTACPIYNNSSSGQLHRSVAKRD
jgi:hypothetical protein